MSSTAFISGDSLSAVATTTDVNDACTNAKSTTTTIISTTEMTSDDVTSMLPPTTAIIPLPPSILKKQQRQIQLAQEKLLRKTNQRKSHSIVDISTSSSSTIATTRTSSSRSSSAAMVWMGDLPLLWTTPKRNYQRLRMLLRAHLPRTIPTPHIKLVHRKAYRSRQRHDNSSNDTVTTTINAGWNSTEEDANEDEHNMTATTTAVTNSNNNNSHESTNDSPPIQPSALLDHANKNETIASNTNPYLGYAILVFRDDQESQEVLHTLQQREVTLASVFPTTNDIEQNKDFYDLMHSNNNNATFRIKIRPVDHHHTVPKQIWNESNDTSIDPVTNTALDLGHISNNKSIVAVAGQDPPLMDRLRPLSTEVLIQRIQQLGGDTSTLSTTISPEALLSLSTTANTTTSATPGTNKKSTDPTSSLQQQGIMTILQEQHDCALQHAVDAYRDPTPKIIHHEGRLIPTPLRDKLLSLLNNLRWAVPNHRNGMNTERYLVLLSNVQNDLFYSDIRDACKELMTSCTNDPSFYYSGIAITKNFVGSPHIDDRDQTYQYAISLGNFTDGGELCVDGGIIEVNDDDDDELTTNNNTKPKAVPVIHVVNTHDRIARIDGRHVHWVRTWENRITANSTHRPNDVSNTATGSNSNELTVTTTRNPGSPTEGTGSHCDRYSLIFYDTSNRCPTPVVDMTNFSVV
jgi:hypothetical protein